MSKTRERLLDDLPESFDGWLWAEQKLIPRNEITLLVGHDGVGKTTWAISFGAALTQGKISGKQEKVFFSLQEDSPSITRARLTANQAEPWLCSFQGSDEEGHDANHWTFPSDIEEFEDHLYINDCSVAIIDSMDVHVDSLTGQKARQTLALLHNVCTRQKCTLIFIAHFNKTGAEVDKAIGGGRGIKAASRCTLVWGEKPGSYHGLTMPQMDETDPEYEQKKAEIEAAIEDFEDATHALAVHKNSYGVKYPHKLSMLYQGNPVPNPLDPNEEVIIYDHVTDWLVSPQSVFRPHSSGFVGGLQKGQAGGGSLKGDVKDLMLQILSMAKDWVTSEELNSVLVKSGASDATIRDARRELREEGLIENKKEGRTGWQWRLKPLDLPTTGPE